MSESGGINQSIYFSFFVVVIFLWVMIHFIYVNVYIYLEHNFDAHVLHTSTEFPRINIMWRSFLIWRFCSLSFLVSSALFLCVLFFFYGIFFSVEKNYQKNKYMVSFLSVICTFLFFVMCYNCWCKELFKR